MAHYAWPRIAADPGLEDLTLPFGVSQESFFPKHCEDGQDVYVECRSA